MRLTENFKNFHAGSDEPSRIRLAEVLAGSAPKSAVIDDQKPGTGTFDGAVMTGEFRSLQVNDDLHFFACDFTFDKPFRTSGILPPALWVGALFSGGWQTEIGDATVKFPADGVTRLLGVGNPCRYFDQPKAKKRIRMASFLVGRHFFERLAEDDPTDQLAGLRSMVENGLTVQVVPQATFAQSNLLNLLNNPYRGSTSVIFVESLIMASLFDLAGHLGQHQRACGGLSEKRNMLAYEARSIIDEAPEKFSSIVALAQELGSNETTLQRQFRKVFDTTIFEYVLRGRMMSAQILVRDGHLSLAEISYRVGYNSPANFSTAYKRYFGHSPRHDRVGTSR